MSTMTLSAKGGGDFFRMRFWAAALLMLGMFLMLGIGQASAAPLAGTSIGNQASATYTDFNNVSRITVSNTVSTVVQQVSSAILTQSQTKSGAPGQPISFPHTITNNGNGPDTFNLAASVPTGALSSTPVFYIDANCDGVADNSTPIPSIGPVAPGTQACFVAQGTLLASGAATGTFTVTATSTLPGAPAIPLNTDTATILVNGVVTISKSVSSSSGPSGSTPVTYTLTYRNTGSQPVFGMVVADTLTANVSFAAAPAVTVNGATVLPAAYGTVVGTTPNRYNVSLDNTAIASARTIVVVIEEVPANSQGTVTFNTTQNGSGPVNNNTAQFCYLDGTTGGSPYATGTLPTTMQPPAAGGTAAVGTACNNIVGNATAGSGSGVLSTAGTPAGGGIYANYITAVITPANVAGATSATNPNTTNTVPFNILTTTATGSLILNGGTTSGGGGNGLSAAGNPTDGNNPTLAPPVPAATAPDLNTVASAPQGTVLSFSNWVWNTGTASDAYSVSVLANSFPTGTSFLMMRSDGVTPLTDSNGDGIVDTGPIPGTGGQTCPAGSPNAVSAPATPCGYKVVVRVILPPGASGNNAGAGYDAVIQSASGLTPLTVNSVDDHLTTITGSTVDLKNPQTTTKNYAVGPFDTWAAGCAFADVTATGGTCSTYVTGGGAGYGGGTGFGEANPVTTISANPASTVKFKLDVVNTGGVPDSFDLALNVGVNTGASTAPGNWTTLPAFTTPGSLPAGFSVNFYLDTGAGDCSATFAGQAVSNTGVIQPGVANTKLVCAVVTVPAGAVSQTYDLFFRAASPTTATGALNSSADVKHDRLFVNTFRLVSITPNGSGQVFPGGSIQYCHTVTNLGNVAETGIVLGAASNNGPPTPWPANATYYANANKNCVLSPADALLPIGAAGTTIAPPLPVASTLTPGNNTVVYIIVVQAPPAAVAGQVILTTLTETPNATLVNGVGPSAAQTVTDTTTVVVGQVTLVKQQVVDPSGNGLFSGTGCTTAMNNTAGGAAGTTLAPSYVTTQLAAKPDQCLIYKVVATNIGTQSVTLVQIFDTTPPNTYCAGVAFSTVAGGVTTTGSCAGSTAATFSTNAVTLAPNSFVDLYFRVRIAP